MTSKTKPINEQVFEWLKHHALSNVAWLFAYYRGNKIIEQCDRKDIAHLFYGGIKGIEQMTTSEFLVELRKDFKKNGRTLPEDWKEFTDFMNKQLKALKEL